MYTISHFLRKDLFIFWYFCTVNPLCRILPPKTGNTPTCIINGLCSNCSHRQWYHFLISWLDEASQWAGSCTLGSASTLTPKGCSAFWRLRLIILGLPLILTEQRALTHRPFGDCELRSPSVNFRHVRSWIHERKSAGVCVRLNIRGLRRCFSQLQESDNGMHFSHFFESLQLNH